MKIMVIILCAILLSGCAAAETFETVSDELVQPVMAQERKLTVSLPEDAVAAVMEAGDGSKMYLCDGHTISIQTLEAGDLHRTIRTLSGFDKDQLTVLERQCDGGRRYEWVWSAVGEGGDQLCRAVVLDDGTYHYCLTAMADAEVGAAVQETWDGVFSSFGFDQ